MKGGIIMADTRETIMELLDELKKQTDELNKMAKDKEIEKFLDGIHKQLNCGG